MEDIQENQKTPDVLNPEVAEEDESKPVVLTDRDIAIFRLIHEHRYLAFNQIKRAFWKDRSDIANAAYRRVQRLLKAGYLEHGYSKRKGLDLYLLSDQSLQELQRKGMDLGLGRYKLSDHFERYVDHDLKVANIRILFRDLGLENWTTERVLKEVRHERQVPDGIVNLRGRFIAIEFENALKAQGRYGSVFDRYNRNPDYYLVIMIVYTHIKTWLFDKDYNPEQMWFVEYNHLMNHKEQALLENKHASFEMGRLL